MNPLLETSMLTDSILLNEDERQLQSLIACIVDQDQQAFAELYKQLVERVYGLVLRITRHKQLAEEVTEDAFWQVWRQAPRFDPERACVLVWVQTIARSRALDAIRRHQIDTIELDEDIELADFSELTPQDLLSAVEKNSQIHQALEQLEPLSRQLVALAFFRGLSHDEIACYMNLPLGSVKSTIRRTLLKLKKTLAETADYGL